MTSDLWHRADTRFAGLRAAALFRDGGSAPADPPAGRCISTIARLVHNAPSVIPIVQRIQLRLPDTVRYPRESLHLSLLGCTPREDDPDRDPARVAAIRAAFRALPVHPTRVHLGALNAVGDQLFVEVRTRDRAWSDMRARLAELLLRLGEEPIVHPDLEPMHLNISRGDGPLVGATVDRWITLSVVELVTTDFTVTPGTLRVHDAVALTARRA